MPGWKTESSQEIRVCRPKAENADNLVFQIVRSALHFVRMLHHVKLVEPLLFALVLLGFLFLEHLMLGLGLLFRFWIFVAHGSGG